MNVIRLFWLWVLFSGAFNLSGQLDKGLVGDYTFNDGAMVNAVDGKNINAYSVLLTEDRFGNNRSACYFQGTEGSFISLGNSSTIKPQNATIALWLRIDRAVISGKGYLSNPVILAKNNQPEDFYEAFVIGYNFDEERIVVASTNSELQQVHLRSSNKTPLGSWHHYALSFSDSLLSLYIDGELEGSVKKNHVTSYAERDSVIIGNSLNAKNNRFLLGFVDDVKIYNRVLSPEEVRSLFNLPNPNRYARFLTIFFTILGGALLASVIAWLLYVRAKKQLRRKEEQNTMLARMNELETRAIRMHMNPHFIFNALNSLQRYILEADTEKAHNYLSNFSHLLRKILESSNHENISLAQEIEILETYINLEKERFDNSFSYEIVCNLPDQNNILIPFMLIQPIVENAIWHGLLPKKNHRLLRLEFIKNNQQSLTCIVTDNGVGIQPETSSKLTLKPSQGGQFIRQRLEIIQKISGVPCSLLVEPAIADNYIGGTCVKITFPYTQV